MTKTLIVGHCNYDGPRLQHLVESIKDAQAKQLGSIQQTKNVLNNEKIDLILFNREFTNGEKGLDAIKEIKEAHPKQKVMLISNFEDAQEQATTLGAMKGFGKAKLDAPETVKALREVLAN